MVWLLSLATAEVQKIVMYRIIACNSNMLTIIYLEAKLHKQGV